MASIDKRKGNWRAQVRRGGQTLTKTFRLKADADAWARDIERASRCPSRRFRHNRDEQPFQIPYVLSGGLRPLPAVHAARKADIRYQKVDPDA